MASVTVANDRKALLCVLAEPLGEDFWIAPDQTLTFTTPDETPMISWYEGGASVWINDGNPYDAVITTETGEAVERPLMPRSGRLLRTTDP